MREIKTKFKSCIHDDVVQEETVVFKTEDGKKLGEVTLRRLSELEVLGSARKSADAYLLKCIESWTFTHKNGKPLELNLENLRNLQGSHMEGNEYKRGIAMELFIIANEMNFPSEVAEKNSAKQ